MRRDGVTRNSRIVGEMGKFWETIYCEGEKSIILLQSSQAPPARLVLVTRAV
jgi:hypothetical protein